MQLSASLYRAAQVAELLGNRIGCHRCRDDATLDLYQRHPLGPLERALFLAPAPSRTRKHADHRRCWTRRPQLRQTDREITLSSRIVDERVRAKQLLTTSLELDGNQMAAQCPSTTPIPPWCEPEFQRP